MHSKAVRIIVQIAMGAIASNAAIACGSADAVENPPPAASPAPFEPPPPPDASTSGHQVEVSSPFLNADAGPGLPNATCQPDCLSVDWLPSVLQAAGLDVWIDPDWRDNGHGDFEDLWGVFAHHTGDVSPNAWKVVRDGRSDLSGPLSQLVLEQNGQFRVVARGVAWHAGQGTYPGLPEDHANFYTIGIEAVNTGLESWSVAQYEAYVRGVAAILKYLQKDSSRVIGHKEWAGVKQGKWDPGNIDMPTFRKDVQALLDK